MVRSSALWLFFRVKVFSTGSILSSVVKTIGSGDFADDDDDDNDDPLPSYIYQTQRL